YIILGLIIVMGVILVINLREPEQELVPTLDTAPIRYYIESCIKTTGEQAIKLISRQGGYYILPEKSIYDVPIYYFEGQSLIPNIDTIKLELQKYMDNNLGLCLENLAGFEEYEITVEEYNITSRIAEKDVILDVNYPVAIKKGKEVKELNQFRVIIPAELWKIYIISNEIIDKQEQDPDFILLSEIIEIADTYDIMYKLEEDEDGNVIYTLVDREPIVSEFPEPEPVEDYYEFKFAIKYRR
ncbi:hypothetical protein KY337_00940, partial [Candidatus Woesearchaeota archaeon]|nr:hypothetical protein [Candidatus Woesearchaeota archaeon]